MKKNVGKKIRLMALLASLTLVLWGGVIACSSGGDDDGDNGGNTEQGAGENGAGGGEEITTPVAGTTIKLKGNFFVSNDENDEWIYCTEELKETKESGVWEGEITAVRGWDNFGLEINSTWYGAEKGLKDVKDAKLVKDSDEHFWLATDKNSKSKVTVNLNTMTITIAAVSES